MDDATTCRPPAPLNFVGDGDFEVVGDHFLDIFIRHGGLAPSHRVLDVGCGIGRMALPLTRYLDARGSYEGFDIVDVGIDWCCREITPRFPNFRFQLADVFNRAYHPTGRYEAREYAFPFADAEFDFVFLTSVFTHLLPADLENYVAEVARVLKPGGRVLATFFLRNAEMMRLQAEGHGVFKFCFRRRGYWTTNRRMPEDAVCYDEGRVRDLFAHYGLALGGPMHYGSWCGRRDTTSSHDLVIATRTAAALPAKPQPPLSWRLARSARRLLRVPLRALVWKGAALEGVDRARAAARSSCDRAA